MRLCSIRPTSTPPSSCCTTTCCGGGSRSTRLRCGCARSSPRMPRRAGTASAAMWASSMRGGTRPPWTALRCGCGATSSGW
eukprot:15471825-Alexandrium_andersonii.AAC.1